MPLYTAVDCKTELSGGRHVALARLPDDRLAVLPVIAVPDFDPALPGAIVGVPGTPAVGEVVEVGVDGSLLVGWIAGVSGVSRLQSAVVQFKAYATLRSELDDMVCPACNRTHHPNLRCAQLRRMLDDAH